MNNINSILIEGNLVKDPLYRATPRGNHVCTFTLASNRYFRQDSNLEKEVGYFDVECWNRLAETCYNQGRKGRGIRVVGRLKQDRWNGSDGKPRTKISIVAEHVEFRPESWGDEKRGEAAPERERKAPAEKQFAMAGGYATEYAAEGDAVF
jgi:single-strand DNA-binding protein